ncbi:DUF2793 domain-containing protein [Methylobacterium oryzae CBMB20]
MSDATPRLGLPLIAASQAQKHVTHNEALDLLDALVQLACLDKDLAAPPPDPAEGDRYLVVASEPGGAWAGLAGQVVRYADGVWTGAVPRAGWRAWLIDEADLYVFDGAAWTSLRRTLTALQSVDRLGINTAADSANRLAVKSDSALLTWDDAAPGSGDMRVFVNRKSAARDAALVFETGYAARALLGTLGSDDFTLKVSPDGAAFATALTASARTGGIDFASAETALAAAPTTDLGAAGTRRVLVTGAARIARFGPRPTGSGSCASRVPRPWCTIPRRWRCRPGPIWSRPPTTPASPRRTRRAAGACATTSAPTGRRSRPARRCWARTGRCGCRAA